MPPVESELAPLQIARLAELATSAWPAWLWSADGSRIMWANAVGAAIFGAGNVEELGKSRFGAKDSSAAQIIRLAATLPAAGQERLERLRGFGASFGRALMCACSRLVMPNGTVAVLVAATEPAGPALPLPERVRRLFPENAQGLAVFAPDGALVHANAAARQRLGGATTLSALGVATLAATALDGGHASGTVRVAQTDIEVAATRLGKDDSRVVVLTLAPQPREAVAQERPRQSSEAAPAAPEPPEPLLVPDAAATPPPAVHKTAPPEQSIAERRHPLRFVWQMDADGRFVVGSDEFIELVGPRTIAACGRLWSDIAAALDLDPDNRVAHAIATRETWSGIQISWPVEDSNERLPVELSGLPVFDRDRIYRGYRGFGVCRDIARINQLLRARRARPIGFMPAPQAPAADVAAAPRSAAAAMSLAAAPERPADTGEHTEPAAEPAPQGEHPSPASAPAAANVVPFRTGAAPEAKPPSLSAVERNAFRELAQELAARLRGPAEQAAAAELIARESVAPEPVPATPVGEISTSPDQTPAATEISPPAAAAIGAAPRQQAESPEHVLLDRVPAGVLVYRDESLLYANRHFLEKSGYDDLAALAAAGGVDALFAEPRTEALTDSGGAQLLSIMTRHGDKLPVEARLFSVPWNGSSALALVLTSGQVEERRRATQRALDEAQNEIRDLKSNLERTTRRESQKAAAAKADFLARVSHEIRTPLNSMIGFAEVIMAERFGAIGNERYREYLRDIHAAGTHLVSVLNDLLDLSKIETGQLDLTFTSLDLNELTQQCVAVMQPHANRARIIIRTALAAGLPTVTADARSLRQAVLNLLSHAIKFTGAGGQIIVSTAIGDGGEAVLRVRDTGVGMREKDIEAVLDPFRHPATSPSWGSGGSGLGLPLTKALAEANRANFMIKSAPNAGTLVEISFPANRLAAQ